MPKKPYVISANQEADFAHRYSSGDSSRSIADHFGCHITTVYDTAKRLGLEIRPSGGPQRRFTEAEVGAILDQWDSGLVLSRIATLWHGDTNVIARVLESNGRTVRRFERWPTGDGNPNWRGGTYEMHGYRHVKVYPDDIMYCMVPDGRNGYVLEHRIVMARDIGRPLTRYETVHHIDGNGLNNDITNLQLRSGRHGAGVVHECLDCGSNNIKSIPIADTYEE